LPLCGHIVLANLLCDDIQEAAMNPSLLCPSLLCPSRHQMAVLAAAFGLALLAAPAAHAFTFEGSESGVANSDGTRSKIVDPANARFGTGGDAPGTLRQGNTTFQFGPPGGASPSQRFNDNANRMLNPLGRPGEDR
jgi:hypothetical protein